MRISRNPAARRRLAALAAAALVAAVAGVLAGSRAGGDGAEPEPPVASEGARREAAGLPLRKQIGLVLVSSFDGPRVPAYLRRRLRQGILGGVILFSDNFATADGLRAVTRTIQRAARGRALVMVDQEGGSVRRVPFAAPGPAQGAFTTPARARASARQAARDLRSLGINVTLAPVADLADGPVMAPRAYAGGPEQVSRLLRASLAAYEAGSVAATAKHFPGLGSARVNTDDGPVTIGRSSGALMGREIVPFRAAVDAGVPLVMASHAVYPAFDSRSIASQSRPLLTGLLRDRLGFGGAIITDSMEADAVLRRSSIGAAAERSLNAGVDLVLMTGSASWKLVFPRLLAKARRSQAFRQKMGEAAARVLDLRRRVGAARR